MPPEIAPDSLSFFAEGMDGAELRGLLLRSLICLDQRTNFTGHDMIIVWTYPTNLVQRISRKQNSY